MLKEKITFQTNQYNFYLKKKPVPPPPLLKNTYLKYNKKFLIAMRSRKEERSDCLQKIFFVLILKKIGFVFFILKP